MNATILLRLAGINAKSICAFAVKSRPTVFKALKASPIPNWLLNAFDAWYQENQPIESSTLDYAFRAEFRNAWNASVGTPSILMHDLVTKPDNEPNPPRNSRGKKGKQNEQARNETRQRIESNSADRASSAQGLQGLPRQVEHENDSGASGTDSRQTVELIEDSIPVFTESEIKDKACSAARWKLLNTNALRTQFISEIISNGWGQGKTDRTVRREFQKRVGKVHRPNTSINLELRDSKDRLADYLLTLVAPVETTGVEGFGKHFENSTWLDQKATIKGILRSGKKRAEIESIYGSVPSECFVDKLFRERHGVASKLDIACDKLSACLRQTTGIQANWAGEFFYWDATRLPIFVNGAWGKARKNGMAHWLHCMTDDRSLNTLMYVHAMPSETAAWDLAIIEWYKRLGYAPPQIYTDNASRLVADLYQQKPANGCTLGWGMRMAICLGSHVSAHTKNSPNAKGRIEAGAMKAGKSELKSLLVARACEQSIPLKNYRCVASQNEWDEIIPQWEACLNERRLRDTTFTRKQGFYDHAESAAKRNALRFDADKFQNWNLYTDAVMLGQVIDKTIRVKRPGENTLTCELCDPTGKVPVNHCDGSTVIIAPSGLFPTDDPDEFRVVIVDALDKARQSKHYSVRARAVAKTFWGDLEKAKVGTHPVSKITSIETRKKQDWYLAANPEARLRQGTTGEAVNAGPGFSAEE